MGLINFLGLRTYSTELRRDLEQLEKNFNDLVRRVAPLFTNEPSASFTQTTNNVTTASTNFAAPTNPVILTHTAGVATTAMRSDAAPKLSQDIDPTWTGTHTFTPTDDVTPVTINATNLVTGNMQEWSPVDGLSTIVDALGNIGVAEDTPTAELSIRQRTVISTFDPTAWWIAEEYNDSTGVWPDHSGNGYSLTGHGEVPFTHTPTASLPRLNAAGGSRALTDRAAVDGNFLAHGGGTTDDEHCYFTIDTPMPLGSDVDGYTIGFIAVDWGMNSLPSSSFDGSQPVLLALSGGQIAWIPDVFGSGLLTMRVTAASSNYVYCAATAHTLGGGVPEYWVLICAAGTSQLSAYKDGVYQGIGAVYGSSGGPMTYVMTEATTTYTWSRSSLVEMIVFPRELDTTEIDELNTYLAAGITGGTSIANFPLTDWKLEDGTVDSIVTSEIRFGLGTDSPLTKLHVEDTSNQIRFGYDSNSYTTFNVGSGSGALTYTMPNSSSAGVLHNSGGSVWSWSAISLTADVTGTLPVANGGTGATTLTGLLKGNGTSAVTVVTDSSTVGQVLRVTGAATYAWGAVDLADTDAITGDLPYANLTASGAASKLLGRGSASGAGDWQEITIGSGLTMTATTLSASGGGGSVASDSIWDAKGDLAVGTGSDTAQRLAVGTDTYVLTADSTQTTGLKWAAGGSGSFDASDRDLHIAVSVFH